MAAGMNFALFLLLPASAATDLTPPARAAAPAATVTTYDAILATEDTPAANDLAKPAVFIEDKAGKSVISASGTRWIA
jgi:hypothetical protein